MTSASLGICSPEDKRIRSPRTSFSGGIASFSPSRMTVTSSRLMRLSLSIIRLARISVMIPVMALKQMTAKKIILLQACTAAKATAITKFKVLNKVKTLRLIICQVLVLVVKSLVCPRSIFLRTSLRDKPFKSIVSIDNMISFF